MALFSILCLAHYATAQPINISSPSRSGRGWTFSSPVLTILANGNYIITGVTDENRVVVKSGLTAVNITLDRVTIDVSSRENACAFDITGAKVYLNLKGVNVIRSSNYQPPPAPEGTPPSSLSVEGSGSLFAAGDMYSPGISGVNGGSGGTFSINRGKLEVSTATRCNYETVRVIAIQKGVAGTKVTLQNTLFDTNKCNLTAEAREQLDHVAKVLKQNKTIRLEVSGHTDNIGSEEQNMQLSKARAKTVFDYLVSSGVSSNRMTYAGYGFTKAVANNVSVRGRALNRRVELRIVKDGK